MQDQVATFFWEHVLVAFLGALPATIVALSGFIAVILNWRRSHREHRDTEAKALLAATKADMAAKAAALAVKHAEEAAKESKETREVIKDAVTNGPLKEAIQDAVKSALKNGH